MHTKKYLFLPLSLFLILILTACGNDSTASDDNGETESTEGEDEEIIIRLGHTGNEIESDPYFTYTEKFNEVLEEETDGRITLNVHPNSQLGDLNSMMEQVNNGNLDMTAGQNTGTLAGYYPNIQVLDLPYAFESLEVGQNVMNGEFGDRLKNEFSETSNMELMSFIPSAFRHFGSNAQPINSPSDLEGLTIRVMEVPAHQEMVRALNATPTVIAFEELYSAMQTGVVDAHENAPYTMLMINLQEVTDYFTLDRHVINTAVSLMNSDFLENMSEADQEIVINAEKQATEAFLTHVEDSTEEDMNTIIDAGVEVTELSDEEFQEFQETVTEPVAEFLEDSIDDGLTDDMLEAIENSQ